ncbi:hypothetical protein AG1IA_00228 [Rhizoctonia solani AG-1 IA]|uniref:Uncharacterized protein n=1 Tax=Thanatephorus cucumeris (strain AG1-IA) TaxID=983506 RepID=L8X9N1_THACA|nr:hypothetical protein AG1IA_00228 [Rhizoctonia solani AG-1 IA]
MLELIQPLSSLNIIIGFTTMSRTWNTAFSSALHSPGTIKAFQPVKVIPQHRINASVGMNVLGIPFSRDPRSCSVDYLLARPGPGDTAQGAFYRRIVLQSQTALQLQCMRTNHPSWNIGGVRVLNPNNSKTHLTARVSKQTYNLFTSTPVPGVRLWVGALRHSASAILSKIKRPAYRSSNIDQPVGLSYDLAISLLQMFPLTIGCVAGRTWSTARSTVPRPIISTASLKTRPSHCGANSAHPCGLGHNSTIFVVKCYLFTHVAFAERPEYMKNGMPQKPR